MIRRPASPTSNGCAGNHEDFLKQGENDRVGTYESAHGTNRTNRTGLTMSVLEGKADFPVASPDFSV